MDLIILSVSKSNSTNWESKYYLHTRRIQSGYSSQCHIFSEIAGSPEPHRASDMSTKAVTYHMHLRRFNGSDFCQIVDKFSHLPSHWTHIAKYEQVGLRSSKQVEGHDGIPGTRKCPPVNHNYIFGGSSFN